MAHNCQESRQTDGVFQKCASRWAGVIFVLSPSAARVCHLTGGEVNKLFVPPCDVCLQAQLTPNHENP